MVRVATFSDLEGVLKLYKELRPLDPDLDNDFAIQKWAEIINDPQTHIVVVEVDGELVSTCALSINKSIANRANPFGIIEHVITARKFRRQGLNRQVLEFAISLAWTQNYVVIG